MNPYHKEQIDTLSMVCRHLHKLSTIEIDGLKGRVSSYLSFRTSVDTFLSTCFSGICDKTCFQSRMSACCSREGILTFFADVVINALFSDGESICRLFEILSRPNSGFKCIYLGPHGCLWTIKPIVCEMFLCQKAQEAVFSRHPEAESRWKELKQQEKLYRWPDRPVLFDQLEQYFIDQGIVSSLMYLHNSPGLLKIKNRQIASQHPSVKADGLRGKGFKGSSDRVIRRKP